MANSQDIVLSYYNVLIRRDDLKTLENHSWLNDTIIGFYFDYLEREKCQKWKKKIVFASPELTQLLKLMEISVYPAILDSWITQETDFIFFPVNNCDNREDPGGAHWSLLIYSKSEAACFHLDSSRGFNKPIAKEFSLKILEFLEKGKGNQFIEVNCPQQGNSYDCGIFVLCFAGIILEHLEGSERVDGGVTLCDLNGVKREVMTARKKILELISEMSRRENI